MVGRGQKSSPFLNSSYTDYIKSEKWRLRRNVYFMRHPKRCTICGSPNVQLHHMDYSRLGRESDADLVPLCPKHHSNVKVAQRLMRHLSLRQVTMLYIRNANFRKKVDNAAR